MARGPTESPEAHQLYLQARYFWNRRTEDGLRRSAKLYGQALNVDSGYARAWAGLADAYLMLFAWSLMPPAEAAPRVREAAARAMELDPTLAEPHATLGYLKTLHEWDWIGAEREFQRAIELDNDYSTAHHWYAFYLLTVGNAGEALIEIERARDAEPLSPIIAAAVGYFYVFDRQYDRALAASLGERDEAFGCFDRAIEERSFIASWLYDPMLDSIRADPRFDAMFRRIGLEPPR